MGLSLDFWFELIAIGIAFAVIITLIPKYRNHSINKARAIDLRLRISETIQLSLPAIAATSIQTLSPSGEAIKDSQAMHFYSQKLLVHNSNAQVLYADERDRVQRFLDKFVLLIDDFEQDLQRSGATEDLLLLGERILLDLKENGLLSIVKR